MRSYPATDWRNDLTLSLSRARYPALGITLLALVIWLVARSGAQLQPGAHGSTSGGGLVSPSVVATYSARFTPAAGKPPSVQDKVPQTLDLLVLWRGSPGWFDHQDLSVGVGDTAHHVSSRGRSLELRIDPDSDTISLQGHVSARGGANVLFVDHVDGKATIAGMSRVEPVVPPSPDGPTDIVGTIARRSPEVFDYLRCDPASADPGDASTQIGLRVCEGFR